MAGNNIFRKLYNSKKRETARLCAEAEEHNFCPCCGMLLCNGELCEPYEMEDLSEPEHGSMECIQCGLSSELCSCSCGSRR
jgi:hypothetical protein